jgi:hypothetical protein
MKLDESKPYGTVTGHATASFEQNGKLFGGDKMSLTDEEASRSTDEVIQTPELTSAQAFLKHILKEQPLQKNIVYKTSQENNQLWQNIVQAAQEMEIIKFSFKGTETWKLPETQS